jgi:hypothetical protein
MIEGSKGSVLIRRQVDRIEMQYQGNQLVNGSAAAYSKALLEQAIELTDNFPFPWTTERDGTQRITDHQRYYKQTFNSNLRGIETLKRWIEQGVREQGTKRSLN